MAAEMWPPTLDMTRDECRGILRRSELETYSSVVSTFRAQGGLSEAKVRILKELRDIFHISQERHKAEARRVANDERLCTVAEMIAGPNTGQEWSKEGHRNFPMLSRAVPHTGLSVIANNAQTIASIANGQLPLPEQTQREITHDHFPVLNQPPVVLEDPIETLMANRPPLLKRTHLNSESSLTGISSGPQKKRLTEIVPINHTNMRIQQLYHTHSNTPNPPLNTSTSVPRKNASQKRNAKAPLKPRVPKPKAVAPTNRTAKVAAPMANPLQIQPQSQSAVAYASSLKPATPGYPQENKSLHGETFPELSLAWTHIYPPTSAQNDGIKFDQIVQQPQQQQPSFPPAITPTSPVQVVFTSHIDLPPSEQPKYQSYPNNLITESTPIQWVEAPPTQPILQRPPPPTVLPPPMLSATLTPIQTTRPIKMAIPATVKKTTATMVTPRAQAAPKPTKTIRRKTDTHPPLVKIPPAAAPVVALAPQPTPPPLAPVPIIDHSSLQISSISNKMPAMTNMNLMNASSKLPTQLMQTTNPTQLIIPAKKPILTNTIAPASSGTLIPLAGAKPKIQVTQQIIMSSPIKHYQSKGNVKLVQSANGGLIIKGPTDVVVPTAPVPMAPVTLAPIAPVHIMSSSNKPSFPKVQLVKKNNSNMILMQKVSNPFGGQTTGTAIKDGRPMKFNLVPNKSVAKPAQPPKTNAAATTLNLNNVQITEDTPVDILPGGDSMIIDVGPTNTIGQTLQPIIAANHIILDGNLKQVAPSTTTAVVPPVIPSTIVQQQLKPIKLSTVTLVADPKRPRLESLTAAIPTTTPLKPEATDWEEALDKHQSKHEALTVASGANVDEMIEEDGSGTETIIMGGYMTSEETNEDDIIQYEGGDSTDYQDEMSLDGVPDTTTKTPPVLPNSASTPSAKTSICEPVRQHFAAIPSNRGTVLSDGGSQDGDDEDTQDGESMMLQMEEFDENGCSQIRNVSYEELVNSGHIIMDDS